MGKDTVLRLAFGRVVAGLVCVCGQAQGAVYYEYCESGGYEALSVLYEGPGVPKQIIPAAVLSLSGAGVLRVPGDYATIQAAIDAAEAGETVLVADGTYRGTGNRDIDLRGKAITVRSENGPENCTIDCEGAVGNVHCGFRFRSGEGRDSVLEGFRIINGLAGYGSAILCEHAGPTIRGNIIEYNTLGYDTDGGPIGCGYVGSSARIEGNIIRYNDSTPGDICAGGIWCSSPAGVEIVNNQICGNRGIAAGGIYIHTVAESGTVRVVGNLIADNEGEHFGGGISANLYGGTVEIVNCTIAGNRVVTEGGGIHFNSVQTPAIVNCVVWGNADGDGSIESSQIGGHFFVPADLVIHHTCVQGWTGRLGGIGNMGSDPLFADFEGGDFHLSTGSPCVDAGDNSVVAPGAKDLDGRGRILGRVVDMGAYERRGPMVWYVDDDTAGACDGTSWADGFTDLQDALAAAEYGDEIRIGQGMYRPAAAGGDRTATFQLAGGVTLQGGFAGVGAADPDARNIMAFRTILSGDLNGDDVGDDVTLDDNCHHVVTSERTGRSTVLDGFVVSDGVGEDNGGFGGGVKNERGSPTIVNCVFRTGRSVIGYSADAIYNRNQSDPFIANCVFEGKGYGRGVVSEVCSPTIVNCVFVDCRWTAIEQYGGLPVIANCIFVGCQYVGFFDYSNADIRNCLFFENDNTMMLDGGAQPVLTDCLDGVDPMFVDRAGGDYHLRPGSPCIDAGDNAAAAGVETDLDGGARIIGAWVDMGVFEAAAMIEGELSVMPRIINRASNRGRILARVRLPENVAIDEIDRNQALVLLPGGAAAERQYVFAVGRAGQKQKRVNIFAFFEVAALLAAVEQNGAVEVMVTGAMVDGRRFSATDTVTIIGRGTPDQSKGPRTQAETGRSRTPSRSR